MLINLLLSIKDPTSTPTTTELLSPMSLADKKAEYLRIGMTPKQVADADKLADDSLKYLIEKSFSTESLNKLVEEYRGQLYEDFLLLKLRALVSDNSTLDIKVCVRILEIFHGVMSSMAWCFEYPVEEGIRMTLGYMMDRNLILSQKDKYASNVMNMTVTFTLLGEEGEWNLKFDVNTTRRCINLIHATISVSPPSKRRKIDTL